ncbi:MAG: hypothetical protein QOI11_730 [Candidatus Eremiobacteraeota bacterium]|jgi:hypothetical protein|nr:hypothetical protein [Candidatus Eremiobacteraeota bacterium]
MHHTLRFAGAAALSASLLLTACAKKTSDESTTTTTQSASETAQPDTSAAPDAAATATDSASSAASVPPTATTAANTSNGASSGAYIDLPVYPGATESKTQAMSMSSNTGSFAVKAYSTKDDAKKVAEWYKSHLPAEFKGGILTSGEKTVGTFTDEHSDGDQSVIVANDSDGTTRIQLSTKHGK